MISKLSKKQKILAGAGIAVTMILYLWISNSQGRSRLIKQLENGDSALKIQAANQMTRYYVGKSSLLDALTKAVNDYDEEVRQTAIQAIIKIDRAHAVKIFKGFMSSGDEGIRMDVTEALEEIGSQSALAALDKAEDRTNRRYERARMKGVVNKMYDEYAREKEKKYKRYRKAYGS